ncbi:ATPase AAA [Ureaplasma diversum]|uniref:ATPase AAA n=1 Tax=Ureaplasma diversum TaxID=42094 RepID=A0A0C5RP15_9BACT|nr:AAA family ATPase [Ureaplasma diversum]AJQ45219.1 ATPase AAA [Ureaplasma diversum]
MKKAQVINLIKYHTEENNIAFRDQAYEIADEFEKNGDLELGQYIMALLSSTNTFVARMNEHDLTFLKKMENSSDPLRFPEQIKDDVIGIINAIEHNFGVNKFLFIGDLGTGKKQIAKQISKILNRDLHIVDFNMLVDNKLEQSIKNIATLFDQINNNINPNKSIILLDEIIPIGLDPLNCNDLREIRRVTNAVVKGLDSLNENVLLIATSNLYKHLDKALIKRFDAVIDFNRYSREDLIKVAEIFLDFYLSKSLSLTRNIRIFYKIINLFDKIPYPGDLKKIIKTSISFSNPNDQFDYLRRLYLAVTNSSSKDLKTLQQQGFSIREIEILTGISKSQVSRILSSS